MDGADESDRSENNFVSSWISSHSQVNRIRDFLTKIDRRLLCHKVFLGRKEEKISFFRLS